MFFSVPGWDWSFLMNTHKSKKSSLFQLIFAECFPWFAIEIKCNYLQGAHLLSITSKHWVYQFDAMGQAGRNNVAGPERAKDTRDRSESNQEKNNDPKK